MYSFSCINFRHHKSSVNPGWQCLPGNHEGTLSWWNLVSKTFFEMKFFFEFIGIFSEPRLRYSDRHGCLTVLWEAGTSPLQYNDNSQVLQPCRLPLVHARSWNRQLKKSVFHHFTVCCEHQVPVHIIQVDESPRTLILMCKRRYPHKRCNHLKVLIESEEG